MPERPEPGRGPDVPPALAAAVDEVQRSRAQALRLVRRNQALERLLELGAVIVAEPTLEGVVERVTHGARELTNAEAGTLFLREGSALVAAGVADKRPAPPLVEFVARSGRVVNVPDVAAMPSDLPSRFGAARETRTASGTRSLLLLPLRDRAGHNLGVLELVNARDETGTIVPFAVEAEPLVQALAAQAAVAVENARLAELSFIDAVTGGYNRRYFTLRLTEEIRRYDRHGAAFSVVIFDVDHFKSINDRFGHPAGDAVLASASRLLTAQSRGFTVIARLGGDEFGAVLPQTARSGAAQYAERIRRLIEAYPFEHCSVTVTVGVASVPEDTTGEGGERADVIIGAADRALYEAKRFGRNRIGVLSSG